MSVHIHPAFVLYLAMVAVFSSWQTALCTLCALIIHEAAHLGVGKLLHEQMNRIDLTPFGGMIRYKSNSCPSKGLRGLCVAAAGPLGNYTAVLAFVQPAIQKLIGMEIVRTLVMANLSVMCLNLLPVLPLDGGNMVLSVGYYLFPMGRLIRTLTLCGVMTGIALILLALYGFSVLGQLNLSLVLIGGYIAVCACVSRDVLLAQNLYAVIQERMDAKDAIRSLRLYCAPGTTTLSALLPYMEHAECAAFVFSDATGEHTVNERMVCRLMLKDPTMTLAQAAAAIERKGEKEQKNMEENEEKES